MSKGPVLITGGNKGIGLATTKKFLTKGYKVIAVARDFSSSDIVLSASFIFVLCINAGLHACGI